MLETINDGQTVFRYADAEAKLDNVVGGDRDVHGCIPSAGYQWCEKLGECVRPWELETDDATEESGQEDFATHCKCS